MTKQNIYLAWETNEKGEPTGIYRILIAPNAKWAASHIKYEIKGNFKYNTSKCTTIVDSKGHCWYIRFQKKNMKNLVKLYNPGYSDDYHHYYDSIYFSNSIDANSYAKTKHGNYAVECGTVFALEDKNEKTGERYYYILKSANPVTLFDSNEYIQKRKKEILSSLSEEDRKILGYE